MGTPHDELLNLMSPLLEEPATVSNDAVRRQRTDNDILLLLEANARLRALVVQLSNLVATYRPFDVKTRSAGR